MRNKIKITLGESLIASAAASLCGIFLELPVWVMFMGWVSYFSKGMTLRAGVINYASLIGGLAIGAFASILLQHMHPHLGAYSLSVSVFCVAVLCLIAAQYRFISNLLCIFIGVATFFAAHNLHTFTEVMLTTLIGSVAGYLACSYQQKVHLASTLPANQ